MNGQEINAPRSANKGVTRLRTSDILGDNVFL